MRDCNKSHKPPSSFRMSTKSFHNVILQQSDGLYRFALSILKEPETAKDAVQDCLAKIWRKKDDLGEVQNLQAWTFRIVKNHCLDVIRGSRHTEDIAHSVSISDQSAADFELLYEDQQHWLKKVLDTLSHKQQEVFHLREIEEMSYQEICDITGLSMNEVKVNLHRARTSIRAKLEKVEAYGT